MIQYMHIADQTTCPLPTEAVRLQSYLRQHRLSLLEIAHASGVRYLTAWKAAQGLPVRQADAARLRAGLACLAGHSSTAPVAGKAATQTARTLMEAWKGWKE